MTPNKQKRFRQNFETTQGGAFAYYYMNEKKILMEQLNGVDVVQIASALVRIPSYTFLHEQEKEIAFYIRDLFRAEGIPVETPEVEEGRYNVTAVLKGVGDGKSLMLSGHMDTVPVYDIKEPFSGRIENGRVYGRGACDMKGPLAAMIAAMIGIKRAGITLPGDLYFTGVIDEEEQGKGVEYLIKNGPTADAVVVGEPTTMLVAVGNRGLEWIKIEVHGKKVHGGAQVEGISAIQMASRLVDRIYTEYAPAIAQRKHPVLGHGTVNVGRIYGGDQPSTVAGSCTLEIDRRWIPGESPEQVYRELNAIVDELHREDKRFKAEVKNYYSAEELQPHRPFCTDPADPFVRAAVSAIEQNATQKGRTASAEKTALTYCPCWTDAGMLAALTDSKCIIFGPGEMALAHTSEESIGTEELQEAAAIYALLALEYCGKL